MAAWACDENYPHWFSGFMIAWCGLGCAVWFNLAKQVFLKTMCALLLSVAITNAVTYTMNTTNITTGDIYYTTIVEDDDGANLAWWWGTGMGVGWMWFGFGWKLRLTKKIVDR